MINVPLSDKLFLRAQGAYLTEEGYLRRGPQLLGGSDDSIGRLQLGLASERRPQRDVRDALHGLEVRRQPDGYDVLQHGSRLPNESEQSLRIAGRATTPTGCPIFSNRGPGTPAPERSARRARQLHDAELVLPRRRQSRLGRQVRAVEQGDVQAVRHERDLADLGSRVDGVDDGISSFKSSGVSDWQLLGMEYRPSTVESDVVYQEFQFNLTLANGKVDLVTGANYFNEDSGNPREWLENAIGSSNFAAAGPTAPTGGAANGNLWGCNDSLGIHVRARSAGRGQPATTRPIRPRPRTGCSRTARFTSASSWTSRSAFASRTTKKDFSNTLFANDNFIPQSGELDDRQRERPLGCDRRHATE